MDKFSPPQLVVRVGLTGHRPNRLTLPATAIAAQIDAVLKYLENTPQLVSQQHSDLYSHQPPVFRFTTGIAQGADAIGAEVALSKNWQLQSVLAFDRKTFLERAVCGSSEEEAAIYRQRFRTLLDRSSSVLELCGRESSGFTRDGYELVGEVILKQSDVLIVVWDGKPARGLGGSAHVMRLASQRGLAVVWIHATRPQESIKVYLPGQSESYDLTVLTEWLSESLILGPKSTSSSTQSQTDLQKRWKEFTTENWDRTGYFIPFFQYLLMLGGRARPKWPLDAKVSESRWASNWQDFNRILGEVDPDLAAQTDTVLWKPFLQADHMAEVYGRAYRGTYVLIYALAALATVIGLLGLFLHHHKPILVMLELLVIAAMITMTLIGRRNRWHERWLEYRAVAEQLRRARMGIWAGRSLEPSDPEGDSSQTGASWISWYARARVRELRLINTIATPAYVSLAVEAITRLEIEDQRTFNKNNSKIQEHLHEKLEHAEIFLLFLLILACAVFLLIFEMDIGQFRSVLAKDCPPEDGFLSQLPNIMTAIGASLPAIGAAILGMRSQGDFSAYAGHSADTAAQLQAIQASVIKVGDMQHRVPDFEILMDLTDRTTEALASDVFAWRMVYRRKVLTVSA